MNKIHHETENRSLINRICPIEELHLVWAQPEKFSEK